MMFIFIGMLEFNLGITYFILAKYQVRLSSHKTKKFLFYFSKNEKVSPMTIFGQINYVKHLKYAF